MDIINKIEELKIYVTKNKEKILDKIKEYIEQLEVENRRLKEKVNKATEELKQQEEQYSIKNRTTKILEGDKQ